MTMIRTEKGKTIHIQHDVASPSLFRLYNVAATKGYAGKYPTPDMPCKAMRWEKTNQPICIN